MLDYIYNIKISIIVMCITISAFCVSRYKFSIDHKHYKIAALFEGLCIGLFTLYTTTLILMIYKERNMFIFQILMMILGIVGAFYSTNRVLFYGKKTGTGFIGAAILSVVGLVVSVIVAVTFGVFAFIV